MERVEGYVDPSVPEAVKLAILIVRELFGEIPEVRKESQQRGLVHLQVMGAQHNGMHDGANLQSDQCWLAECQHQCKLWCVNIWRRPLWPRTVCLETATLQMPHPAAAAVNWIILGFGRIGSVTGERVLQKVCEALLKFGPQPLRDIGVHSGLSKREVCNGIIVLVQHSFVAALLQEEVVGPRKLLTQYVYKADTMRIIHTLRQPRMLMHIADTMGEWPERVVEIVTENGRLTFEGIVQRLGAKFDLSEAAAAGHAARSIVHLMRECYLEQAPPCDLPLSVAADPRKAKRKSKSKTDERDQLLSAHELTILQYNKMRFKLPPSVVAAHVAAVDEDDDVGVAPMHVDDGVSSSDDAVVLLRLNYDSFAKCFRHQACVDMVSERFGRSAGLVVKAMLELSRPREVGPRESASAWVSMPMITEQLARTRTDAPMEPEEATDSVLLELLDADVSVVMTNDDGTWSVNTSSVMSMIQFQVINGHLKQRFGQRGLRIWRLLLLEHFLQAEHVEKEAMINTRDVRKLIYAMLKAGYVDIQEIPKSAEHAPSKTIFTYGVVYFKTQTQLITDLYKAAGNLLSRCQAELQRERTVIELASRKVRGDAIKMSAAQLKTATRLQGVVRALHTSLLRLDEMMLTMSF